MSLGRFPSPPTINTDYGTHAIDLGVLGNRLALLVVLVFGMSASTDGAYNRVLGTRAAGGLMAEGPAARALRD